MNSWLPTVGERVRRTENCQTPFHHVPIGTIGQVVEIANYRSGQDFRIEWPETSWHRGPETIGYTTLEITRDQKIEPAPKNDWEDCLELL